VDTLSVSIPCYTRIRETIPRSSDGEGVRCEDESRQHSRDLGNPRTEFDAFDRRKLSCRSLLTINSLDKIGTWRCSRFLASFGSTGRCCWTNPETGLAGGRRVSGKVQNQRVEDTSRYKSLYGLCKAVGAWRGRRWLIGEAAKMGGRCRNFQRRKSRANFYYLIKLRIIIEKRLIINLIVLR
jgi:hypothetical protein